METGVPRLTLYWREYCHLCHDMLAQLLALRDELGGEAVFSVDIVDIDADSALEPLYDELVPVLSGAAGELCHYHLNPDSVRAYLAEIR
ncbi:MAG TPA: glutaredoxin family protein [Rhodocyclaceae bacterium]|nr:glutaredoxin family protein [Rhodocyclaceae bacterium]